MPYSFTQIEKDKSRTIGLVFCFLILFYFGMAYLLGLVIKNYLIYESGQHSDYLEIGINYFNLSETFMIFIFSLFVAFIHWTISVSNLINKILSIMQAQFPDINDSYHQMFKNIVEEVSVATGGQKIEAVVVPSMAMNAFALSDFSGRSVIGVTEGLLSRLSREQIEAVVGHEAAHIVSGDCLATTVTSSMFQIYCSMLKGMEAMFSNSHRGYSRSRGSSRGGGLIVLIYLVLYATKTLSELMNMFISREREYRADAVAVRLTRNPLSLASALYAIGYRWRGSGLALDEMKAIFIVNPNVASLDNEEGFISNLFSTHPPMAHRLKVLLDLAHADIKAVEESVRSIENRPRIEIPQTPVSQDQWLVNLNSVWQGPFTLNQLMHVESFTPESWVKKVGSADVIFAYQDPAIAGHVGKGNQILDGIVCPKCRTAVHTVSYEGIQVYQCGFCRGSLLPRRDVEKIIMRREIGFSDRVIHESEKIIEQNKKQMLPNVPKMKMENLYNCTVCRDSKLKMIRKFFNGAYCVEVDECISCGYLWFDSPELEVLQYLIEKKISLSNS